MDEIATAIYKGKSSIYYYFKSKEEIFEAVVEKEISSLRNELTEATASTSNPIEQLKLYITIRMNSLKKLLNLYEAIKSDYLSHLDFINSIRLKYDQNEINNIKKILEKGIEQKIFTIDNTELTAASILSAMRGLEVPFMWTSEEDVEKRTECLLQILFNGILKK